MGNMKPHNGSAINRFEVLDAIRFVAALWVAIFHLALHLPDAFPSAWMRQVAMSLFSGQMAVVAFFIISGFCIHYPTESRGELRVRAFLIRRILRIGVPLAIAVSLGRLFDIAVWELNLFSKSPLFWSLVCEVIYYVLYPLVLPLMRRFGCKVLVGLSFLPGLALFFIAPSANWLQFTGDLFTAVFAYPCWLLGACLAERMVRIPMESASAKTSESSQQGHLFGVRLAMIGMSAFLATRQNFFVGAGPGAAYLLLLSAIPLSFWIWSELRWARPRTIGRLLCRGGQWSYSLYIVHPVAYMAWGRFHPGCEAHSIAYLSGALLLMLAASYTFFLLIEGPSVRLAKLASDRFAPCPRCPVVEMSA